MKRSAVLFAFFLLTLSCTAQIYFRAGAVAHHYNMRQYNELVDKYNEITPGLTTPMPYQTWMFGPDIAIGKRRHQFGTEFSFKSGKGIISASGIDSTGATYTRDVQTSETSFCFGMYIRVLQPWPVYMSFDGELSIWTNKTRVNGEAWRKLDHGPTLFITPGLTWIPFKGWFSPVIHMYYAAPILQGYQEKLWQELDPDGFASADKKDFWVRHGHFGIGVSFLIGKEAED